MNKLNEAVSKLMTDESFSPVKNETRRTVTESLLQNQIRFMRQGLNESDAPTNQTAGVVNWDPVLIKMVRRSTPQLMAFDLAGVQPMSAPTGQIFAMRARYNDQKGPENFGEANTAHSGTGSHSGDTSGFNTTTGHGMEKEAGEGLGGRGKEAWAEMGFTIERSDVSAKTRKLKAQFSRELQYDLMNVHGLNVETELANILSQEITAEIDRELLRTINTSAVIGCQNTATPGTFNMDADSSGRWLVEKFKGLLFRLELEANQVSRATRRGRANRIIASSNVVSALNMAGVLEYNPNLANTLNVDETSSTFAGILFGRYQVHIDPYATIDYVTIGYKGVNSWDAGIYYAPYLPLEMYRGQSEDTFDPKIGFATRYGMVANPFAASLTNGGVKPGKGLGQGENEYFRKFRVTGLS